MEFSLENMCRTCMNEDGTMFSVFTMENRGISKICYADMLMACASLHVERNDELPQKICQHCLKHLSVAFSFKQQSERSEATLREITKNPDIEFIKEEIFDDETYVELNDANEDNNSIIGNEIHLEDSSRDDDDDQHKFKLTEDFLEDEYIADEDLAEEIEQPKPLFTELDSVRQYVIKPKLNSDKILDINSIKKEKFEFDATTALDTEFLEDEYVLEYDSTKIQRTETDRNKIALPESEEFLDDNILVKDEISPTRGKIKPVYDLETLRKAVLKPKSPPLTSTSSFKLSQMKTSLDLNLDRIKKSVLTPKLKPSTRILSRDLKCPYCDQTFRTQQSFKKHKKQHLRKLKCELCLKEFRSSHGLRYHMKIHNGIKNYPCNFGNCTKRFRLKQALDKHLSIHNNEKNHLCALCGKTYSTYDALHYHLKAHRGERPYLCIHCGKTFKQSCHLKSHMWIHSGVKPHVCSRCGKCYTSGHQLKKHVQKHCPPPAEAPLHATDNIVETTVIICR